MNIDSDAIIQARIRGDSVLAIAKQFGCTVADVNDVLDRFASMTLTDKLRTHTLALELARLDDMQRVFEPAMKAGDIQAAALVTKFIERRCILLGLAAPPRVDPHILELQVVPAETSTERIRAAIYRIRKLPKPEPKPEEDKPN